MTIVMSCYNKLCAGRKLSNTLLTIIKKSSMPDSKNKKGLNDWESDVTKRPLLILADIEKKIFFLL
jgi:hypothetical protein